MRIINLFCLIFASINYIEGYILTRSFCARLHPRVLQRNLLVLRQINNDMEGYGPLGTLSRQGPIPFFIRIFQRDQYEQAVSKYMRRENCSRTEAMANMDAYFQDPNGWLAERARAQRLGKKTDYYVDANQDNASLALTLTWSLFLAFVGWKIFSYQVLGISPEGSFFKI